MAKILVIGASRGIGRATCEAAAIGGHDVRAMSRSGTLWRRGREHIHEFRGDALRSADVERALDGIDTVVLALGVPVSLDLMTKPVTLFSEATRVLLPAMERLNVNRLIAVTGFGAGDSKRAIKPIQRIPFRLFLGRAYDDKSIQEKLIERSGLDWLIVRPGVLTDGPPTRRYRVLAKAQEWRNGVISRADVADFVVRQLDLEELGRRKPVIIRYRL
jgi:uncharacterized protein YbjT (DUF2867 family)